MAAFSSILSNAGGWAFEDPNPISTTTLYFNPNHDYIYFPNTNHHYQNFCPNSNLDHQLPFVDLPPPVTFLPSQPPIMGGEAVFSFHSGGNAEEAMTPEKKRKLYHNASERDRRKKINSLYSTLRAVLPINDQKKKLSNPDTVARAVKYIPELQNKVNVLTKQKQELLSSSTTSSIFSPTQTTSYSVQVTQLGNGEISIQISSIKSIDNTISIIPVSEVLRELEEEHGLLVMQVSSSESTGRVFHYIHVEVEARHGVKCESLREKIFKSCHYWEIKSSRPLNGLKVYDSQNKCYQQCNYK